MTKLFDTLGGDRWNGFVQLTAFTGGGNDTRNGGFATGVLTYTPPTGGGKFQLFLPASISATLVSLTGTPGALYVGQTPAGEYTLSVQMPGILYNSTFVLTTAEVQQPQNLVQLGPNVWNIQITIEDESQFVFDFWFWPGGTRAPFSFGTG